MMPLASEIGARHPYTGAPGKWRLFSQEPVELDDEIVDWADKFSTDDLASFTPWVRGSEAVETDFGFNVVHIFNHQTHHRGQVHAMLTAAGATPEPTDLQILKRIREA